METLEFNQTRFVECRELYSGPTSEKYNIVKYPYDMIFMVCYLPLLFFSMNLCKNNKKSTILSSLWFMFNITLSVYSFLTFLDGMNVLGYIFGLNDDLSLISGKYMAMFLSSKYIELADSFFIVFSGKPVMFLHYYHHILTLVFAYINRIYILQSILYIILMNSAVHSAMYFYYALACFNIRVPKLLKKSLTIAQISQMFCGIGALLWNLYVDDTYNYVILMGIGMYVSYAVLFIHFYNQTYQIKKNK